MTTITNKSGKTFNFTSDYYIIESNHGNHLGFHRKWSVWAESFDDACKAGKSLANYLNEKNNVPEEDQDLCLMSGDYDLRYFKVVSPEELIDAIDNSGTSLDFISHWAINKTEIED